ncbi:MULTISPECIES: hypothetical protein [Staphylococcus]|uniref:hypothetical protein n=1 Tax=Staphylococcus TaxID=1279 RepID=UPI0021CFF5ED|nr:hypothetical protein [Staphylococcus sp. IVB6181]UXV35203.1 hypothetical protein MUA90_01275 [Staphylococcus sp. IVB6181]
MIKDFKNFIKRIRKYNFCYLQPLKYLLLLGLSSITLLISLFLEQHLLNKLLCNSLNVTEKNLPRGVYYEF